MFRYFPIVTLLVVVACASCDDGSTGPVGAPLEGEWFGDLISFQLGGKQLSNWFVIDIDCTTVTEEGGSSKKCHRKPDDIPQLKAALQSGVFSIKLGDLRINGTFVEVGHVVGTWVFKPEDCCQSEGDWEAWHETWHDDKGPPGSGTTSGETGDDGTTDGDDLSTGTDVVTDAGLDDGGRVTAGVDGAVLDGEDGADDSRVGPATGEWRHAPDATAQQEEALSRVNWYRKHVGVPLMHNESALNVASQSHAQYYVTHVKSYKQNKVPGGAHSEHPDFAEGYTGTHFADRVKNAGYKGSPGWEVMAFLGNPTKSVDSWVETVYHRIPILSPDAYEGGYGGVVGDGASCDVMDFGRKNWKDKSLVVVYPFDGQVDVPEQWNGAEFPTPPAPPNGYPSGTVITVQTAQGSSLKIQTHELRGPGGEQVPHIWHPQGDNQFLQFTWAMYSHEPLAKKATYTVEMGGALDGASWKKVWSFTTR